MIDPAGPQAPAPRRADRWPALIAVLALLCGGIFAFGVARGRATTVRTKHAERSIRTTLDRQGAALLRADPGGWLSDVDPALSGDLSRLYANLRGLQVSGWLPRTRKISSGRGSPSATPPGSRSRRGPRWSAEVQIRVCFATAACARTPETYVPSGDVIWARTEWIVTGNRAVLTAFDQLGADGALPWKRAALTFATGRRVVVAAAKELTGTTPAAWLPAAERAARVADRYALTRPGPGRYVLYLAGEGQWNSTMGEEREAAAFVDRTSEQTAFAIVDATGLGAGPSDERLLRHELGHIATLLGTLGNRAEWAIEGMAEYIAYEDTPVRSYMLLADARFHVDRTGWHGRLDLAWSAEPGERSGYYAMGFLATRCLAETYGKPKLLAFFTQVVRQGEAPAEAAPAVLGVPWNLVEAACKPKIEAWLKP